MNAPRLNVVPGPGTDDFYGYAVAEDIAVRTYLEPIRRHLASAGATEAWINRPGELILEVGPSKISIQEPALTFKALMDFAQAIAVFSPQQQAIGAQNPILSATLPDGERVQIVMPPAVEPGTISFTIRIPGSSIIPLETFKEQGAFSKFTWARPKDIEPAIARLDPEDQTLCRMLLDNRLDSFLKQVVEDHKNIAVAGDTGSGKTTLMKSLCQSFNPNEHIVTIEDVREIVMPEHHKKVHLLYSKGGQGASKVSASDLISSCMRMKPDRVLLAELRGSEAWDFLKLLTTGHSGSITSLHAESCSLAFQRFMFMCKENVEAASADAAQLTNLCRMTLDIVIHVRREVIYDDDRKPLRVERFVDEVYFDPWAKQQARFGSNVIDPDIEAPEEVKTTDFVDSQCLSMHLLELPLAR